MTTQIWNAMRNARRAPELLRCAVETPQWMSASAAYLGFSQPHFPFVLRLRSGEKISIEELTDLKAFWQIFLRRIYRVHTADRTIIDLGANVGAFTLYAARCAPQAKIFAVEPFPSTFSRLVKTTRDHNLDKRVTCLNFAVADADGVRIMSNASLPSQRRKLASNSSPDVGGSGTPIAVKTLTIMLNENDLHHVDMLKVDIEGSEYEVLLSTSQNVLGRINRIAMEYHGDSALYSKQQLFDHLGHARFTVSWDVCDRYGYGVAELIRRS